MKGNKKQYVSPQIEIITVENEGVMAGSVGVGGGYPGGGEPFSARTRSTVKQQGSSPLQEIEDILNDFFTVNK